MFGGFKRTQQRIGRSGRIAEILIKYGFDFVVQQLGLAEPGWLRRSRGHPAYVQQLSIYERIRCMLEELGPTFVKLGQAMSTRADLLPPDLIAELDKLQDKVPPFPFPVARAVVEAELGEQLENLFLEFDTEPFAAASIGQVHRAVLFDSTQVVVKVQRPGIERETDADLLIMRDLAHLATRRTEWGKMYAVDQLVEEFGYQLREQLDYTIEGRHNDSFRRIMPEIPRMYVPKVFWSYSSRRLLTTEFVEGIKLDNFPLLDQANLDRKDLARAFVEIMATQALSYGFYHADPHPGNLVVSPDGTIIFMDFGMVGYLDDDLKEQLLSLILGVVRNDIDDIVYSLLSLGVVRSRIDRPRLKADIRKIMRKYYEQPLADMPPTETIDEMLSLAANYQVRLPADLTLLIKVALMVEGLATQLDPALSIVDVAKPFAVRIQAERMSPQFIFKGVSRDIRVAQRLMRGLPGRVDGLLQAFEGGEITLRIELAHLDRYIRQISITVNRLAAAIVVASMFLASTLALRAAVGPSIYNISLFAVIGFAVSLVLGLWLFAAILRSGAL